MQNTRLINKGDRISIYNQLQYFNRNFYRIIKLKIPILNIEVSFRISSDQSYSIIH